VALIRQRIPAICQAVIARVNDVAGDLTRPGFDAAALSRLAAMAADRAGRCRAKI